MDNDNYTKSLAAFLFEKMHQHQSDESVRINRPRLDKSGLYFDERDIQQWIQSHARGDQD